MKRIDDKQSSSQETHDDEWNLPQLPLPTRIAKHQKHQGFNSSTPLLPLRQRQRQLQNQQYQQYQQKRQTKHISSSMRVIQGRKDHNETPMRPLRPHGEQETLLEQSRLSVDNSMDTTMSSIKEQRPTGLSGFLFGFMYEEPFNESIDYDTSDALEEPSTGSIWNPINVALFCTYTLTTAATTVPVLLIPTIGKALLNGDESSDASAFTSRAAASAVLGTAVGKFLNGPVGDVFGARRTSVLYAMLLSLALLVMGFCQDISSVTWACFFVEFFQSVQWPCILIILATHYGPHQQHSSTHTMYEGGIYIASIASRFGSLLGIPFFSTFIKQESQWQWVCFLGAWIAMIGASVAHLFLADSPHAINEPQNPLDPIILHQLSDPPNKPRRLLRLIDHLLHSVLIENLMPSLQHVLRSGTFWIVALAHTGSSMIRTSERILSTYYHDTSMGYLSQEKASGLSIFASLGTILGLAICGTLFTSLSQERQRKWFVSRLYMLTIASCYTLAIFGIPSLHKVMDAPGLVLFFQIFASFCMSLGISVMFYQIPGLVASTFGNHKGLFSSYVDGVGYGLASVVWKIVASTVSADTTGAGWAYGWAAVALLLILCAILMVEFMEHYFVRPSRRQQEGFGAYETIILA